MRIILLTLLLLMLAVANLSASSRSLWRKNEAAIAQIEQQRFTEALDLLLPLAAEVPANKTIRKNIATSYLGAGQQQIHARAYLRAAELLQKGKEYNDQDPRFWLLRGIALLKNGQMGEAEIELNEAWAMSGDEPLVLQYLGLLYYQADRMYEAVDSWQRALDLDPGNKVLVERLAKARRELTIEKELDQDYSAHFVLNYADDGKTSIGGDILDALEDSYTWAGAKLGAYPERQTTVILYTRRQFRGLTGSPEWSAGLFDGKIRLPIGGLDQVDDRVRALLAHEFMHLIVREIAGDKTPFWLNEGLAELAARELRQVPFEYLPEARDNHQLFALAELEGSFRKIAPQRVGLAYEQSYSFVRYLIDRFGWYPMAELLPLFKRRISAKAAMKQIFGEYGVDLFLLERDWRRQI